MKKLKKKWVIGGIIGGVLVVLGAGVAVAWRVNEAKKMETLRAEEKILAEKQKEEAKRVESERAEIAAKEQAEKERLEREEKAREEERMKKEAEEKAREEARRKASEQARTQAGGNGNGGVNGGGNGGGNAAPYYIKVSRSENVMMVYGKDATGNYGRLVKTFIASTGKNDASPLGVHTVDKRFQWRWAEMIGGAQAQYVTRITGLYLMHSVPYFTRNQDALKWEEYNKLGQQASLGCVRLQLDAAKWIYENVTTGTKVEIYHGPLPAGVVKPVIPKIDGADARRGWDPTNPLAENPWRGV